MKNRIWQFLVKISVVGNAILLVILAGGSHALPSSVRVAPHTPVHLVRDFGALETQPFLGEVFDAQKAWDDATGTPITIFYHGSIGGGASFDAAIVDAIPGGITSVALKAHNGQQATAQFQAPTCPNPPVPATCWWGFNVSLSAGASGVNQVMQISVLNAFLFFPGDIDPGNRWRTATHELGHAVGLGDHDDNGLPGEYHAMMDSFPDTYPGDYIIANFPNNSSFPDEAACVRLLFDLAGKQDCQ